MLVYIITLLQDKPSLQSFKKRIMLWSCFSLFMGFLTMIVALQSNYESYTKGFLIGVAISSVPLGIYGIITANNSKKLKTLYIKNVDERNQEISKISAVVTVILRVAMLIICICLNAFLNIQFDYRLFLIFLLYFVIIVYVAGQRLVSRYI